jgi:hypothetical protein
MAYFGSVKFDEVHPKLDRDVFWDVEPEKGKLCASVSECLANRGSGKWHRIYAVSNTQHTKMRSFHANYRHY